MVFAIHWHESAMDLHVFPILIPPPPPSPSHPSGSSQCTSPEHNRQHWNTLGRPYKLFKFSFLRRNLHVIKCTHLKWTFEWVLSMQLRWWNTWYMLMLWGNIFYSLPIEINFPIDVFLILDSRKPQRMAWDICFDQLPSDSLAIVIVWMSSNRIA